VVDLDDVELRDEGAERLQRAGRVQRIRVQQPARRPQRDHRHAQPARACAALAAGRLEPTPQDASRATYAPNLSREDARIDWSSSAEKIRNQVRAFSPKPGAWAEFRGKEVKIWRARVDSDATDASPGQIVAIGPESIRVATGEGTLWLEEVQEAGKSRMGAGAFARGARLAPGERFS
ncbi:MAG TPA: hypothetical protein PLH36_09860, partial [Armatimonadota bacterium]|nr:hypothetical protein [Armatimonadota bacterium]